MASTRQLSVTVGFVAPTRRAVHARAVPSDDDLALADDVSGQLIRLLRLMDRRQAQYQAEHPDAVERATYYLLVHLVKGGPQRAGALAESVHSDPSTISRQVGHLVRLGLVERMADPEDGRATLLTATDEGRRVFEENRRMRIERFAEMLSDWPTADRRKFAELLGRFATAFESSHRSS
jgi:DNA-binding MarR family transcriptional regulator